MGSATTIYLVVGMSSTASAVIGSTGPEREFIVKQKIALLGDVGCTLILPNSQCTIQTTRWGMQALSGIEFYPTLHSGIIFEMGFTADEKCIADKLRGEPYYYTYYYYYGSLGVGFILSVGWHLYL